MAQKTVGVHDTERWGLNVWLFKYPVVPTNFRQVTKSCLESDGTKRSFVCVMEQLLFRRCIKSVFLNRRAAARYRALESIYRAARDYPGIDN